ncbi:MAG: 7TM-DISM domain-containing protein [Spirochaetota bacterium]
MSKKIGKLFIIYLSCFSSVFAGIDLNSKFKKVKAADHCLYRFDASNKWNIQQMTALGKSKWKKPGFTEFSFGFTRKTLWVKCEMKNVSDKSLDLVATVDFPCNDTNNFYLLNGNVLSKQKFAGDMVVPQTDGETRQHSFGFSPMLMLWENHCRVPVVLLYLEPLSSRS